MLVPQLLGEKWIVLGDFNEVHVGERVMLGEYYDIGLGEFRGMLE